MSLERERSLYGRGALADLVVWDWAHGPVAEHRGAVSGLPAQDLHVRIFAWMTLGDERNVAVTYVAGRLAAGSATGL